MDKKEYLISLQSVAQNRTRNMEATPARLGQAEKEELLRTYHPDVCSDAFSQLRIGSNRGQSLPTELRDLLEGRPVVSPADVDLKHPSYETDVLVIGGGGAGAAAAIEAQNAGCSVLIVTKFRMGDSNTIMAEGGMQAAVGDDDLPADHFTDAYGGGQFAADRELLVKLVNEAPEAVLWLRNLGMEFDCDPNGELHLSRGGGTSHKRMLSARDSTGAEIMRTLRDEVQNRNIPVLHYTAAVELLTDRAGRVSGAVLQNMENHENYTVRAKSVVLATGGCGQLHIQGFPTSNHGGSTADGLVMAYRAGALLCGMDSMQYHPTGVAYPSVIRGKLVTEKARSLGAKLINAQGEPFVHPMETRDVVCAAIIRECKSRHNGVKTPDGYGVWLDTPMIDAIHGAGKTEQQLPGMLRMFARFGVDIRKEPVLVYPTLHYQNGGLKIDADCRVLGVPDLFAAGEVTGGIHGKNRLMGNALTDVIVFGRTAGRYAARCAKATIPKELTLFHVQRFTEAQERYGVKQTKTSPLLLPKE